MPGDLPGWRQTFAEDFLGSVLPTSMYWYSGQPGGEPLAQWSQSHCTVRDSVLNLRTSFDAGKWVSGGGGVNLSQTYGKYMVRMRSDPADGISNIALLWPNSGTWPVDGEIDFREGYGDTSTATVHFGEANSIIQRSLNMDFTKWQIVGVEWTPGKLVYTINDLNWATVKSPFIPSGPMNLDVQAEFVGGSPPPQSDYQIDWIVQYEKEG